MPVIATSSQSEKRKAQQQQNVPWRAGRTADIAGRRVWTQGRRAGTRAGREERRVGIRTGGEHEKIGIIKERDEQEENRKRRKKSRNKKNRKKNRKKCRKRYNKRSRMRSEKKSGRRTGKRVERRRNGTSVKNCLFEIDKKARIVPEGEIQNPREHMQAANRPIRSEEPAI
jgi:hypothetical protein